VLADNGDGDIFALIAGVKRKATHITVIIIIFLSKTFSDIFFIL
jgi:hypothetical protein